MPQVPQVPQVIARYQYSDVLFEAQSYSKTVWMPPHSHAEAHLVLGMEGTVKNVWRKQTVVTNTSTLFFIPPGESHATHFQEGVKLFVVTLPPPWIERIRPYCALVDSPVIYQNGMPTWHAMRLYREFLRRDSATPLILEGLMLELFGQMSHEATDCPNRNSPQWLRQARDYLHAHFTESLSLEAVAAAASIHPAHLTRAFRLHYHCTLGDYVRRLRIEYACHLLSTSERSLSQITLDTGFANQSHFSRTFKLLTGMTPAEYRKLSGDAGLRQEMLPQDKT